MRAGARDGLHGPTPFRYAPDEPPAILATGRRARRKNAPVSLREAPTARATCGMRLVGLGEGSEPASQDALVATLGIPKDIDCPGYQAFVTNPFLCMA
jgi:hypothetical protein